MVSAQKPNQYQLSIAQQFVQHFPFVNYLFCSNKNSKDNIINHRLLNVLVFILNQIQ
jgi:hypothetical protein